MSKNNDSLIVYMPDGSIKYCDNIENDNPYTKLINNDFEKSDKKNNDTNNDSNSNLHTTIDVYEKALILEKKSKLIRLLCICDMTTNLFFILSHNSNILGNLLVIVLSLYGYNATLTYNKSTLLGYLIYQYIQAVCKTIIYVLIVTVNSNLVIDSNMQYNVTITNTTDTDDNITYIENINVFTTNSSDINNNSIIYSENNSNHIIPPEYMLLYCILTLGQVIITSYVHNYYNALPSKEKLNEMVAISRSIRSHRVTIL